MCILHETFSIGRVTGGPLGGCVCCIPLEHAQQDLAWHTCRVSITFRLTCKLC